jgi:hypothetical protein
MKGNFTKQHLAQLSGRPNFEIQLMLKIIITSLSANIFIKIGFKRLNTALESEVFV